MKIICLQDNLKEGLSVLERATSKNQTMPILHNILLKTENNLVSVFATDLEIGIENKISCKVEKNGEVVVPVKTLLQFIQNMSNTRVTLELKNNALCIETENNKTKIPIFNTQEFPLIPKIQHTNILEIQSGVVLKNAIQQVLGSISNSYTVPEITGILWIIDPHYIKLVSTDSFRLAEKIIFKNNNFTTTDSSKFILPQKTAQELIKNINKDEPLTIKYNKHQIVFSINTTTIISRLITGDYPKYEQIIPSTGKTIIEINKNSLTSQIKLASVFSSKINDIKISVKKNKKIMEIKSQDQEKGEFYATLDLLSVSGDDVEVVFNYKYLLDALINIVEDDVVFELNGSASPALFKTKTGDYRHVVMPIKT